MATREGLQISHLNVTFPYRWLRDSCNCPSCVHPSTQQKLHRSSDIPASIAPESVETTANEDGVHVIWAGTDQHRSFFPRTFLEAHANNTALHAFHHDVPAVLWSTASALLAASGEDLEVPYNDLGTPRGLLRAITQLQRTGLLFVRGVPHFDTSDSGCEIRQLAARFAELRETFYGAVWDVKNIMNSRNIAYTNLFLRLHMDLQYFESPPRYQILHCLRNRVFGGTSLFVDAFAAAASLRTTYPEDFMRLATIPVPFQYINDGRHLHHARPTISLSCPPAAAAAAAPPLRVSASARKDDEEDAQAIVAVSYSPPFQAPLPRDTPPAFYDSLSRFAALVDAPAAVYARQFSEGDAVVFDNRRVLHGRTAFENKSASEKEKERESEMMEVVGESNRWLKGCYFEGDLMANHARILRARVALGEI